MAWSTWLITTIYLSTSVLAFVDFGTITQPFVFQPTFTIPRPHQLPDDVWMRYGEYSSQITAIAPSVRMLSNGSHATLWSLHFQEHRPTRTVQHQDLRRRGVLRRGVLPPIPTCRQCDRNGNTIGGDNSTNSGDGSPTCSVANYNGVFQSGGLASSSIPDYCFTQGYTGALLPSSVPTDAGLPCCPVCYPPGVNATGSGIITSGVLSTTTPLPGESTTTPAPGGNGDSPTVTVTNTITASIPVTVTQTTLSIETVTPTGPVTASPTISTGLNTIIGCGTASGCGTVDGSGTVYLAPFGFPAVTSSGIVSGCAPTIVGCGTMRATSGKFTGTAEISGCGEGSGSATMIGSGTVWPAGFMDMVSFVSSGTVTGSGRVKGCGYLTGTGVFTISEPFTTTVTPGATPTVNVYVSYCPPEAGGAGAGYNPLLRLASNFTDGAAYNKYALSPVLAGGNYTQLNATGNGTSLDNPLCHVCPEDSGICCPLATDCGSDGHCPWTALQNCGYARFGFNLVDVHNSSESLGMGTLPAGAAYSRLRAPGIPGSKTPSAPSSSGSSAAGVFDEGAEPMEDGLSEAQMVRRWLSGKRSDIRDHWKAHNVRVGVAHAHGHRH